MEECAGNILTGQKCGKISNRLKYATSKKRGKHVAAGQFRKIFFKGDWKSGKLCRYQSKRGKKLPAGQPSGYDEKSRKARHLKCFFHKQKKI